MKKVAVISILETIIMIGSLLLFYTISFPTDRITTIVSNVGVIFCILFLVFLLVFGIAYTAIKKEPRILFINIFLFLIYLVSPVIISTIFIRHG